MRYDAIASDFQKYLESMGRTAKTIYGYQSDIRRYRDFHVRNYNVEWHIEDTTTADVTLFLQTLYDESGLQPSSRNRILHGLRAFFQFCCNRGFLQTDPSAFIKSVRSPRQEGIYLSQDEYTILLGRITNPPVRTGLVTQWYTGVRVGELLKLSVRDINLETGWIYVVGTHDSDRRIPIHPALYTTLENYLAVRPGQPAPHQRFLATAASGGLSPKHYNLKITEAVEELGWSKRIRSHVLRHSFATNLAARNVSVHVIQHLLGHKPSNVTYQYMHANEEQLIRAINLL